MYPKVKVREQEQEQDDEQSPVHYICSSERECNDDYSHTIARIPKSYVPKISMPTISVSTGPKKSNKKIYEDDKPNIRARPVPMPRAVLSSPDNDGMVGGKHKNEARQPSALSHKMTQTRHAQCKVVQTEARGDGSINIRR